MSYVLIEEFKAIPEDMRACALVGYFLQTFSLVEFRLDQLIIRALGLQNIQGTILTKNIDMRRKLNIAKVLAHIQNVDQKTQDKVFNRIHEYHDLRNTAAHDFFISKPEGVEFLRVEAKNKLTYPVTIWSVEKVIEMTDKLLDVISAMDDLSDRINRVSLSKLFQEPRNALWDLISAQPETPEDTP